MSSRGIKGLVFTVLGLLGGFYAITTYASDTSRLFGYTYTAPFTSHEVTVIAVGVLSVIFFIAGLCCLGDKSDK